MDSDTNARAAAEVASAVKPWVSAKLPSAISWFQSASDLVAVVAPESDHEAGRALSYGLGNLESRRLHLLAPKDRARSAVRRLEVFDVDARVYTVDKRGAVKETRAELSSTKGPEAIGSLRAPRHAWLLDLLRWVELEKELVPMHRANFRSWRLSGKIVVKIEGKGKPVLVAGVGTKNSPDVSVFPLTPTKTASEIKKIRAAIERGLVDAGGTKHRTSDEHIMQLALQRNPHLIETDAPLIREFPAFRPDDTKPTGWARGFIDLLGQDLVGDLSVVETKIGPDPMLLLQAVDYLQWVSDHRVEILGQLQLDQRAEVHIRLAVGKKGGRGQHVHPLVSQQIRLLKPAIEVSSFLISEWGSRPKAERIEL